MPIVLSQTRKGELYAFSGTILWSLFPIVTLLSYANLSPIFSLAINNLLAGLVFILVITFRKKWNQISNKQGIKNALLGSLFINFIFYTFFFWGLKYTTAGNASIVSLMEICFAFLIFGFWQKEKFRLAHIFGAIIMLIGAILILFPGKIELNFGDGLILIGCIFAPIGNHFQQKARRQISAEFLMFVRSIFSLPFIFLLAYLLEPIPSFENLSKIAPYLLFNGIVLFGLSKLLWIESIHRISIAKATAMNTIGPAFTLFFAYFMLREIPTLWQILGLFPILIGAILITKKEKKFFSKKQSIDTQESLV